MINSIFTVLSILIFFPLLLVSYLIGVLGFWGGVRVRTGVGVGVEAKHFGEVDAIEDRSRLGGRL